MKKIIMMINRLDEITSEPTPLGIAVCCVAIALLFIPVILVGI